MSYEPLKSDLRGVAFTNPTPFSDDGEEVLHDELADNVRALKEAGARLVLPCGNTGEYYSLSDDERVAVVETVVDAMDGTGSVVAGVGGSTKSALDLISRYEEVGADGMMVMHPVHTYMHEAGVRHYYERIADATDLGVVLYKRGPELSVENIAALSERENVVAVKFAVNDVKEFSKAVEMAEGDVVWSNGIAERFAPAFAVEGAEGFTTGIGNFVPKAVLALMEALREGDYDRAKRIRDTLWTYEDLREEPGEGNFMDAANNVPAVKYGMELAGLYGGPVREPLVDLGDEDRARAEEYYERIRAAEYEPAQTAD
ncbi:dihydrodipicolinate synthase family protein [Halegenticoccus soli]|uniref:dihydrodipicolinate synthase family protein n=1 Tax=Halegenticoccus soli TaxID=1985678 RepID=UPI000C6D81F6|nr:dihydrodipicolinate synthase family protein [Halegenticoccus soli]